jgi:hypothetical protein
MGPMGLPDRLEHEAQTRPKGVVTMDQLIAALAQAKVTVDSPAQHAGFTFGAAYCKGARIGQDLGFSVCEYASVAEAQKWRLANDKAFQAIKGRKSLANQSSVLMYRVGTPGAESDRLEKVLVESFAKLKP